MTLASPSNWRTDRHGRLTELGATLDWNSEDPATYPLTAAIGADSVDTDYGDDANFDEEIEQSFGGAE